MSGLTREDIDHILKLVDRSDFDELILEMGDLKLELRKSGTTAAPETPAARPATEPAPAPAPAPAPMPPELAAEGLDVPAPLLGVYYHAPKPGAAPFVAVGDRVQPDSVIGIIEVMKLMNQVTAGVTGIVTQVLAPNGEMVEHGQPLIRVKPD